VTRKEKWPNIKTKKRVKGGTLEPRKWENRKMRMENPLQTIQ